MHYKDRHSGKEREEKERKKVLFDLVSHSCLSRFTNLTLIFLRFVIFSVVS